ncbi:histidine kinase : Histidine kinase OS=Hyalangium minutum GN=DB31_7586 PE=4 SV=1: HisKA: HATPase_c [Gemmata massiliana]|uniref:histidine kinase n=1 Tax=Gemmata massiliana TaxID=1210884 RepID=A0A6P2CUX7_9BACT|nr:HAMP domain-containing sensor histidine kinase [Gemmata massiliana]VTR92779.1 histidine kinase : Histidine kinase OS=Hyalangium minutum GN=DB31_7586 PE=4 SV=1: HisKA: HATPase_c [Gemmata massiliana]
MSTSEPHQSQRIARPKPGDERSWLGLVLDFLPIPAVVLDLGTGSALLGNRPAVDNGVIGAADEMFGLAAEAAGGDGAIVTRNGPGGEARFRVFSRVLPPADGEAPLALLTFLPHPEDPLVDQRVREVIETRDEFFSVATHELKDPLFSVQLSLQLLQHAAEKQGPVPVYVAHHLDVAGRQTARLARLIDNMLDVSRIRSGRLQLDPETLDLAELARDAAGRFRESARAAGCDLDVEATGQVIGYFDRLKLDQVLSNLLTNALKYGAGRPVVLRVREVGDAAVIEVEDGGPGVAAADRERIFARFERASGGHKKESLGLGLYIVRSIAEAHGGTATVRGVPGQGATFVVTLPRNRVHHKAEAADGRNSGVLA